MSTLEELDDFDRQGEDDKKKGNDHKEKEEGGENEPKDDDDKMDEDEDNVLDEEILGLNTRDIQSRNKLLENDGRIMKSELSRLSHEKAMMVEKIKDNIDKIANNR